MRRSLFRFTIRRSMAVVAIVAIVMALGITAHRLRRLRADYQSRAAQHAQEEQGVLNFMAASKNFFKVAEVLSEIPPMDSKTDMELKALLKSEPGLLEEMKRDEEERREERKAIEETKREMEKVEKTARAKLAYCADLKKKYRRAADHPWESVPPDAKEPGPNLMILIMYLFKAEGRIAKMGDAIDHRPLPPGLEMTGVPAEEDPARRTEKE
jgi:hypothetical protein